MERRLPHLQNHTVTLAEMDLALSVICVYPWALQLYYPEALQHRSRRNRTLHSGVDFLWRNHHVFWTCGLK
jgi:hypothetical protein